MKMETTNNDASIPNTLNDRWIMKDYQKDIIKLKTKIKVSLSQKQ